MFVNIIFVQKYAANFSWEEKQKIYEIIFF